MQNYPLHKANKFKNFRELINGAPSCYGGRDMFRIKQNGAVRGISAEEFWAMVEGLGSALLEMGLLDAKVAVIGDALLEWIVTYYAAVCGGGVIVPVDKELPEGEILNVLKDSGAKALVYSRSYEPVVQAIRGQAVTVKHFIEMEGGLPPLIEKGAALGNEAYNDRAIDENALAALLYTSGTTGRSKGVMLTQKNIIRCAEGANQMFVTGDTSMLVLPMHHSYGFAMGVVQMMAKGASICISDSPRYFFQNLALFKPDTMFLVPAYVELIYKRIQAFLKEGGKKEDINSALLGGNVKYLICGGAPLAAFYPPAFRELKLSLLEGYGITECAPLVSVNRDAFYADGSVGLPIACCEVKINDPKDGEGDIFVRGDNVMLGYYQNEPATKEVMHGGWFDTGDIGRIDENGFLYITGRRKNLIVLSNGKNVHPEEIEDYLLRIPEIKEVVVYAKEEDGVGEVMLAAEIYPGEEARAALGAALKDKLRDEISKVNRSLPGYKQVQDFSLRDKEFEKTTKKSIKRFRNSN